MPPLAFDKLPLMPPDAPPVPRPQVPKSALSLQFTSVLSGSLLRIRVARESNQGHQTQCVQCYHYAMGQPTTHLCPTTTSPCQGERSKGTPTRTRTGVTGFKVLGANHYTMGALHVGFVGQSRGLDGHMWCIYSIQKSLRKGPKPEAPMGFEPMTSDLLGLRYYH